MRNVFLKTHTQENKFNGLSFYWLQLKRIVNSWLKLPLLLCPRNNVRSTFNIEFLLNHGCVCMITAELVSFLYFNILLFSFEIEKWPFR